MLGVTSPAASQAAMLADATVGGDWKPVPEVIAADVPPAVVRISAIGPFEQIVGHSTGFIVRSSGLLVTSYRSIADAIRLEVELSSGEKFGDIYLVAVDRRRDLAILRISVRHVPHLELDRDESTLVGDPVYIVGNAAAASGGILAAQLAARRAIDGVPVLELSTSLPPGFAGAPVVNRRGELVGVATSVAVEDPEPEQSLAVPARHVRRLLSSGGTPRRFSTAMMAPMPRSNRDPGTRHRDTLTAGGDKVGEDPRRWLLLLEDWNVKIYVDRTGFEPVSDDVYSVWTRWEHSPDFPGQLGTGGPRYATGMERTLYDCRNIRSRTMKTTLYTWEGEIVQSYDAAGEWEDLVPGSIGEAIAAEICTAAALAEARM